MFSIQTQQGRILEGKILANYRDFLVFQDHEYGIIELEKSSIRFIDDLDPTIVKRLNNQEIKEPKETHVLTLVTFALFMMFIGFVFGKIT